MATAFAALTNICLAQSPEHRWQATLHVLDEAGEAVVGAAASIAFSVPKSEGQAGSSSVSGVTDGSGLFVAEHRDSSVYLDFSAKKAGYYRGQVQYLVGFSPADHPGRLTPDITLVLRRVVKPIPMFAGRLDGGPPKSDKPVAFDLESGDWVESGAQGKVGDIIFSRSSTLKAASDYESRLTVTFPHDGDGIVEFVPTGGGSVFRSPYEAADSGYEPRLERETSAHAGRSGSFGYDAKRNYFIRVRTVLDERGNIKSPLYGKIYGDFMRFTYYLNPKPNDHNIEFDPTRDLVPGQSVPVP